MAIRRNGLGMLAKAFGILALCLKEAPEFAAMRRDARSRQTARK